MGHSSLHCSLAGYGKVTGLWVADSSIIPQVPRANTNATAIVIGERVADWVAGA
ncbi:MAG: GMC oxidoreductase [Candidatus Tectomicrobia bacterium]